MPINVPLSWLREYIDIPVSPQELAARLTLAGVEVEHIRVIGAEWDKVVVGRIASLERHPNADRLWITAVDYGGATPQQVVTGAQNLQVDARVPLAFPGAVLIDGHSDTRQKITLKPGKLRGVESAGMVCSELELGLSDEHEGIMILPDDAPVGRPLQEVLGDTVLEIATTPNLGRTLSMVGVAREVAALFGGTVHRPSADWEATGSPVAGLLDVEIADPDLCSRYSAAVVRGVRIGPAPEWIQRRITLAGMRPVSNVVDITNYVMLEMGQPLHAFDYAKVHGQRIIVRRARPGERLVTLDHEERTLDSRTLVIADTQEPVGLAGVMGGADSEITPETADILLESANFSPTSIRRTARLLHLPSEAAYRFERNVDQQLTVPAMKRAAELMRQYAGGTICEGYVDAFPAPKPPVALQLAPGEVRRLLGIEVPAPEIASLLRRLEFTVEAPPADDADAPLTVHVPSYRNDVTIPADLVEEVARMVGYDRIPETLLDGGLPPQAVNYDYENRERIRDILAGAGLDEVITYSPISSAALARMGSPEPEGEGSLRYRAYDETRAILALANPLSSEQDIMRPALLPGMLGALRTNLRHMPRVYLFELGSVFWPATAADIQARHDAVAAGRRRAMVPGEAEMPVEPRRIGGLLTGPRAPRSRFARLDSLEEQTDFYDGKGAVETLLAHLGVGRAQYEPVLAPWYHPGRVAGVILGDRLLGVVGELHPRVAAAWELEGRRIIAFDLDLDMLLATVAERARYQPISRYPAVTQDLALVVPDTVPAARVEALLRETGGKLLADLTLFDVYTGTPVPSGHRSLAYAVTFQALDRTLSEEEVTKLRGKLVGRLQRELGAQLRT
ncbi:MAG TPA: phenylalanine--tRNA ligase subunit beta [Chloroflexia bacterium]|nr:phenylalanine--tRNA ligase subunit beta [Chloroflexia bacterium]